jgi:hypothetical protein
VNGGGGAYLSLGTALEWPETAADRRVGVLSDARRHRTEDRAEDALVETARLVVGEPPSCVAVPDRVPLGLFDYNVAPFFQSFIEVRVERRRGGSACWPYGVHGRLRWRDLSRSAV